MYLAARSWGVQPGEFWSMTMGEWMLEAAHHANETESAPPVPGKLSPAEFERFSAMMED